MPATVHKLMSAIVPEPKAIRHARIELPADAYARLQDAASRLGLSVAAFMRQAVLSKVLEYERLAGLPSLHGDRCARKDAPEL